MEKDCSSILNMLDIYFSSIKFTQNKKQLGEIKLVIDHAIEYQINQEDDSVYQTIIKSTIKDDARQFSLELITNGIFSLTDQDVDESRKEVLLKMNTVAIMFPYIRSEVSLLTAQPGLTPVQMPIIDVSKLVLNQK